MANEARVEAAVIRWREAMERKMRTVVRRASTSIRRIRPRNVQKEVCVYVTAFPPIPICCTCCKWWSRCCRYALIDINPISLPRHTLSVHTIKRYCPQCKGKWSCCCCGGCGGVTTTSSSGARWGWVLLQLLYGAF